jgi:hypothetical protein
MQDSRIVQQKIQSTESAHGLIEQTMDVACIGNVGWDGKRAIANRTSDLLNSIYSPADQRHSGSFPR